MTVRAPRTPSAGRPALEMIEDEDEEGDELLLDSVEMTEEEAPAPAEEMPADRHPLLADPRGDAGRARSQAGARGRHLVRAHVEHRPRRTQGAGRRGGRGAADARGERDPLDIPALPQPPEQSIALSRLRPGSRGRAETCGPETPALSTPPAASLRACFAEATGSIARSSPRRTDWPQESRAGHCRYRRGPPSQGYDFIGDAGRSPRHGAAGGGIIC